MQLISLLSLAVFLITTAITPNKIIAGVVLLVIIIAAVVWWMGRSRGRGTP
jgi:hypothetical protein